jgi:hypothetical protein
MPGLSEGQHVRLEVSTLSPEEQLALAARFYAGLSEEDIEEIERIVLDRSRQRQTLSQH